MQRLGPHDNFHDLDSYDTTFGHPQITFQEFLDFLSTAKLHISFGSAELVLQNETSSASPLFVRRTLLCAASNHLCNLQHPSSLQFQIAHLRPQTADHRPGET